jgi:hypothetical protein
VDVLVQNILLFKMMGEQEEKSAKFQDREKYDAFEVLENSEINLKELCAC